jgi:hypothetical protein
LPEERKPFMHADKIKQKNKSRKSLRSGWLGIGFYPWVRILADNSFNVDPRYIPLTFGITLISIANTFLGWLEKLIFRAKIRGTEITPPPVFIIGHWRSGTTLLHELLGLDGNHCYPTTFDCFIPNHFLLTKRFLKSLLSFLVPAQRVQDNMASDFDHPQEDEIALCLMGVSSPYQSIAFPKNLQKHKRWYDPEVFSKRELEKWERTFVDFLKRISFATKKRIILKSPTHTFRIKELLKLFPEAVFIHIVRDPYRVFQSTFNLWKFTFKSFALHTPEFDELKDYVFDTYIRMNEKFDETRVLIPPSRFYELRYEDLVGDTEGEVRKIYSALGLGNFESELLPAMKIYLAAASQYKTNQYEMPPELRAEINRRWGKYFQKYGYPVNVS